MKKIEFVGEPPQASENRDRLCHRGFSSVYVKLRIYVCAGALMPQYTQYVCIFFQWSELKEKFTQK